MIFNITEKKEEKTVIVTTASDLEAAIRKVVVEIIEEKREVVISKKISRKATAQRLQKTPMTLTRWEKAGKIHPIKIGRSVYYMESEVKDIEEGKR